MQSIQHFAPAGFCSAVDGIDADCRFSSLAWPKTDEAAVNRNVIFQHPLRIHLTITLRLYFFEIVVARVEGTGIQAKPRKMKALLRTHSMDKMSRGSCYRYYYHCRLTYLEKEKAPNGRS